MRNLATKVRARKSKQFTLKFVNKRDANNSTFFNLPSFDDENAIFSINQYCIAGPGRAGTLYPDRAFRITVKNVST
jgi:hypothetical protein